jgi:hypothetical protein
MDSITIQSEIARLRIQDRLMEAGRMREARDVHTPRRPRPRDPERSR